MSVSARTLPGSMVWLGCFLALAACSPGAPSARSGPPPVPLAPPPLNIAPDRTDVVFRYFDPTSGEVKSATKVDAIPEAARREVVVFDPTGRDVAGWDQVADLTKGLPASTRPVHDFAYTALTNARAAGHAAGASAGGLGPRADLVPDTPPGLAHEIVMFSSTGCGYCAKARRFFADHQIPFTEYDLDGNPGAPQKLAELARKAGVGQRELQGVPIFFIDGRPILGWDQNQIASILGV